MLETHLLPVAFERAVGLAPTGNLPLAVVVVAFAFATIAAVFVAGRRRARQLARKRAAEALSEIATELCRVVQAPPTAAVRCALDERIARYNRTFAETGQERPLPTVEGSEEQLLQSW